MYKRQVRIQLRLSPLVLRVVSFLQTGAGASPKAVSYTHLDVYKRQDGGEDSAGAGAETPAEGPSAADRDNKGGSLRSSAECGWHHEVCFVMLSSRCVGTGAFVLPR